jgi:uncharacterized membrane protein YeaQ/YmgE (transglycosylase-associated protein family)
MTHSPNPISRSLAGGQTMLFTLLLLIGCLFVSGRESAASEGVGERAREVVEETSRTVSEGMGELRERVDEARFKNRTSHQVVAWAIMGVLVGAVAGMVSSFKSTGIGKAGRLLLGLAGAFLGGVIASVSRFDLELDPIVIRYEELIFSLVGALLLIGIGRLVQSRYKKK